MNTSPRILVVSYHFPPDQSVGSLRWAGILKYLERRGWRTLALTGLPIATPAGSAGRVVACPRRTTLGDLYRTLRHSTLAGSGDGGAPAGPPAHSPTRGLLGRLRAEAAALIAFPDHARGWVWRCTATLVSQIDEWRPDIMVTTGPPHAAHIVGLVARAFRSVRWIADFRDPWAGPLSPGGQYPVQRALITGAATRQLERLVLQHADLVLTTTEELQAALASIRSGRCVAFPNGVDLELLPVPDPSTGHRRTIVHVGTIYARRDVGIVFEALRDVLDRNPRVSPTTLRFRLAGHIEPDPLRRLREDVDRLTLAPYVETLGVVPRADALALLARADLALILAQDQEIQVPAKLYEAAAMGVPTLAIAEASSATWRECTRLGLRVLTAGDRAGLVTEIERMLRGEQVAPQVRHVVSYERLAGRFATLALPSVSHGEGDTEGAH